MHSQGYVKSVKCPYAAVEKYMGRLSLSCSIMACGLKSNFCFTSDLIFVESLPSATTRSIAGLASPKLYATETVQSFASPLATMFFATYLHIYAALRSL